MKINAAVTIAAFYLLLSTGMFICICGSYFVIDSFAFVTWEQQEHQSKKMDCNGEEDCPCCTKHGNYIIKENIKPVISNQITEIPIVTGILNFFSFQSNYLSVARTLAWPKSNSPPPGDQTPIYIKIRCLII